MKTGLIGREPLHVGDRNRYTSPYCEEAPQNASQKDRRGESRTAQMNPMRRIAILLTAKPTIPGK